MRSLSPLPWVLALLALPLHAEPMIDTLITASDLLNIRQLGAPTISPAHTEVAYTVRTAVTPESGPAVYTTRLWLATIDGSALPRELATGSGNAVQPAWHPSGDRIAFIKPGQDRGRIWILPITGGESYAAIPEMAGISHPQWSPDGTRLLFTAKVTYDEARITLEKLPAAVTTPTWSLEKPLPASLPTPTPSSTPPTKPNAAKSIAAKPVVTEPNPDGTLGERRAWLARNEANHAPLVTHRPKIDPVQTSAETTPSFTHLFVVNGSDTNATPVDITPGFASYENPSWMPDSQSIVCSGISRSGQHVDRISTRQLVILKADGSELHALLHSEDYSVDHPLPSADGKLVAFTAQPAKTPEDPSYGQTVIGTVALLDGKMSVLTAKLDRCAANPTWATDDKYIYFTAENGGGIPLYRVAASGGNAERITSPDTGVQAYAVAPDNLILVTTRPGNPGELYRTRITGRDARILTSHNGDWVRDKKLAVPERRKLKQADGTEIDYWVVKPPYLEGGFKYPLLLLIHDGPSSMWGPGHETLWHDLQFFAGRGYGVVFANPRGSSGYGYKFQHANFQNWGTGPASDVLAVADAVAKEDWVDPERQVILGEGFGAYLTTWILTQNQRFKAGIAARGVYDLTVLFGENSAGKEVSRQFGGYPWQPEIRPLLEAQSPFFRFDALRTPLLIQQAANDNLSDRAQGELLYRSLKILDRPVEYIAYPYAGPDSNNQEAPADRIDRLVRFDEFFQRFIGTPAQPVPVATPASPTPAAKPAK